MDKDKVDIAVREINHNMKAIEALLDPKFSGGPEHKEAAKKAAEQHMGVIENYLNVLKSAWD